MKTRISGKKRGPRQMFDIIDLRKNDPRICNLLINLDILNIRNSSFKDMGRWMSTSPFQPQKIFSLRPVILGGGPRSLAR